jgi:hypothetical protein
MGNYSKLIGSIVGGVFGLLATFGLPVEWATPEIQGAIVTGMSAIFTFIFPANTPTA